MKNSKPRSRPGPNLAASWLFRFCFLGLSQLVKGEDKCFEEFEYARITDTFGDQMDYLIDENAENPFDPFGRHES